MAPQLEPVPLSAVSPGQPGADENISAPEHFRPSELRTRRVEMTRLEPRAISRPAKIGIPIGVIVGVVLLSFCLYPFVVKFVNRRRKRIGPTKSDDAEGGEFTPGATEAGSGPGTGTETVTRTGTETTTSEKIKDAAEQLSDGDSQKAAKKPELKPFKRQPTRRAGTPEATDSIGLGGYVGQNDAPLEHDATPSMGVDGSQPATSVPPPIDTQMSMVGHSASYYSTVPTSSFGVDISPESWDPARAQAPVRRTSSGWSGKTRTGTKGSFSQWFRFPTSSKGSTSSPSTIISPATPTPVGQPVASHELSESPTDLAQPPNALSQPSASPGPSQTQPPPHLQSPSPSQSPPADVSHIQFPKPTSPPMPLLSEPALGTIAPWDVMPAATSTEQDWKRDAELAGYAPGSASPPAASPSPPNFQDQMTASALPNAHTASGPVSGPGDSEHDYVEPLVPIVIKTEPETELAFEGNFYTQYPGHSRNDSSEIDPTDVSVSDVSTPFPNSEHWSAANTPLTNPIGDSPSPGRPGMLYGEQSGYNGNGAFGGVGKGAGSGDDGSPCKLPMLPESNPELQMAEVADPNANLLRCDCGRTFNMPHQLKYVYCRLSVLCRESLTSWQSSQEISRTAACLRPRGLRQEIRHQDSPGPSHQR